MELPEEVECCYAISETSFVGVGELLCGSTKACEADLESARRTAPQLYKPQREHNFKIMDAGESGVGKR